MRKKFLFKIFLVSFLVFMICVSYKRYHYFPLDGDLPAIVLPQTGSGYSQVMNDPFGFKVVFHNAIYPATNRFFAHLSLMAYFKNLPLWLQFFFTPINSIYIACGIAKTIIHFFIIYLIAVYVTNKNKIYDFDILLVAAIATPFFQTYGYYEWMAIIDSSITYTFFYALAISLVLLFFLPFYHVALGRSDSKFDWLKNVLLILFIIIISFNGPLNAPVIVLVCSTSLFCIWKNNYSTFRSFSFFKKIYLAFKKIPGSFLGLFSFAIIIGLYSLYIGRNNSENLWVVIPVNERYSRMVKGVFNYYFYNPAQPILIIALALNTLIISKSKPGEEAKKMFKLLRWFPILAILYILLLPLGGYRPSREYILRWDTILPVTLGLILFYCHSTFYIIKNLKKNNNKKIYYSVIIIISTIYFYADWGVRKYNACEKRAFQKIADSKEKIVFIESDCAIMNWHKISTTDESKNKVEMLLYWNVIKEPKLFYQK